MSDADEIAAVFGGTVVEEAPKSNPGLDELDRLCADAAKDTSFAKSMPIGSYKVEVLNDVAVKPSTFPGETGIKYAVFQFKFEDGKVRSFEVKAQGSKSLALINRVKSFMGKKATYVKMPHPKNAAWASHNII